MGSHCHSTKPCFPHSCLLCWYLRPHHRLCSEDLLLGCGQEALGWNSCPQKGSQLCLEMFPPQEMGNVGICSKHSSQPAVWPNIPVPAFLLLCSISHTIYLLWISLRSRSGCRQVVSKYCVCRCGHRKTPTCEYMCLSSPWAGGAGMYPCVHAPCVPSPTYIAFPFHCRAGIPPDTLASIHLLCCFPHRGYQNLFLLTWLYHS